MAFSFRAQSMMLIPDYDTAEHWARRAIEVGESVGAGAVLAHAYNNLGTCLLGRSDAMGVTYLRRSRDLALQHHLPDEVGRANTNLSGQGGRIFPLGYREMEQHLVDATDYSGRTIPDGIFDRWNRVARAEFLMVSARWEESEAMVYALDADAAEAYLRGEILCLRATLHAYRGRYDDAATVAAGVADTARRIGDLQAVLPALVTRATILIGQEEDGGAVAAWREAVERRGDIRDGILSAWVAFEAADGLTTIHARHPDSTEVRDGLQLLAGFCVTIAPDVLRPGDLVQAEVRRTMLGAAVDQLASLARRTGSTIDLPQGDFVGRADALPVLDREHRLFDAARVRLWLAEDGTAPDQLPVASATFEELGAHPYLERARRLRDRVNRPT
jgi:hypothetical protein